MTNAVEANRPDGIRHYGYSFCSLFLKQRLNRAY